MSTTIDHFSNAQRQPVNQPVCPAGIGPAQSQALHGIVQCRGASIFSESQVNIQKFMAGYQVAWEARDPASFAALFHEDGKYHNTPFQVQEGKIQLAEYWKRVQLQEDVQLSYEVLADHGDTGIAHWHVTYQVASEELFQIWARSTGTGLPPRNAGDPLPRMVLDGMLRARFSKGLCTEAHIWWHSMPQAA